MAEGKLNPLRHLDPLIVKTEQRLTALRALRELDAELLAQILAEIPVTPNGCQEKTGAPQQNTIAERLRAYLLSKNNEWTATPKIIAETGLVRGTVGSVLYKRGSQFESKPHPTDKKVKLWRVRKEVVSSGG